MTSPVSQPGWRLRALLCGIVLAAYVNSFGLGFALDGRRMALEDPRVQAVTSSNIDLILGKHYWWPETVDRLYRPLTTASFLFNYAVLGNGSSGVGYHVVNFLLHALNVLLVFELARKILARTWAAFFAAALWGVHPVGTDAVANVAGRADLLATAAVLGGLLVYIRRGGKGWLPLFAIAALGVFSKESAAVLIGMMLLWDLSFGDGNWRSRLPAYGAVALSLAWMLLARHSVLDRIPWPEEPFLDNPLRSAGFLTARLTALKVIGRYLFLLAVPWRILFDYSYNEVPAGSLGDPGVWAGLFLCTGILAVAILRRRKDPVIFWAVGFFSLALLPVSNLFATIGSIMALRFLYLPAIGFAIAVTALIYRLRNEKSAQAILAVLVLLFAVRTLARNPAWADDGALARADIANGTRSYRPHRLLGEFYYNHNSAEKLDLAIAELEEAWNIVAPLPPERGDQQLAANLGLLYKIKGDRVGGAATESGRAWYEKSIAVLRQGEAILDAQVLAIDRAQQLHGRPPAAHVGNQTINLYLARSYAVLGRYAEAVPALRKGRQMSPTEKSFYDELATAYAAQGKLEQAAIVIDQKAYVFGISPATLNSARNLYERIPDGSCAVSLDGGSPRLNLGCPRLRQHMCIGWADLARMYTQANLPAKALEVHNAAVQGAGCSADLFGPNATVPML